MKHYLKHKGYYGEVYYSEEDETYVGVVLGICSMIAVHENTFSDTIKELIEAIDEYLEDCAEGGWTPNPTDLDVVQTLEAYFIKKHSVDFLPINENKLELVPEL